MEDKSYLNVYLIADITLSALFFGLLVMERPKKEKSDATTANATSARKTSRKLFDVKKPAPATTSTPASGDEPPKPEEQKKDD